jgi:hypothetical protein
MAAVLERRVLVIGDELCGSQLAHTGVHGSGLPQDQCKHEVGVVRVKLHAKQQQQEHDVELKTWDMRGLLEMPMLRPLAYADVDVVIAAFSAADPASFDRVKALCTTDLRGYCPSAQLVMVACETEKRAGLSAAAVVTRAQGMAAARALNASAYFEGASHDLRFVAEVFEATARLAVLPKRRRRSLADKMRNIFRSGSSSGSSIRLSLPRQQQVRISSLISPPSIEMCAFSFINNIYLFSSTLFLIVPLFFFFSLFFFFLFMACRRPGSRQPRGRSPPRRDERPCPAPHMFLW